MSLGSGVGGATQPLVIPLGKAEDVGDDEATVFIPWKLNPDGTAAQGPITQPQVVDEDGTGQGDLIITSQDLADDAQDVGGTSEYGALRVANVPYVNDVEAGTDELHRATGGELDGDGLDPASLTFVGQDVRSFLYAWEPGGATFDRLRASAAGSLNVAEETPDGVATTADNQLSTTAEQVLAANTARRFAIVQNLDATDNVRVGDSNVSSSRGIRLGPGESVTLETTAAIFAVAEANTPSVSLAEVTRS